MSERMGKVGFRNSLILASEQLISIREQVERLGECVDQQFARIRVQLKLARLFPRIMSDLEELRANASRAIFAKEGEEGYVPRQEFDEGRFFDPSADENQARSSVLSNIDYVEQQFDSIETDPFGLPNLYDLVGLELDLVRLHESVREAARDSRNASLNGISLSVFSILDDVDNTLKNMAHDRSESAKVAP